LLARALLDQKEFSTAEIRTCLSEHHGGLKRKSQLTVHILVQAVETTLLIAEQERCGARLALGMAAPRVSAERRFKAFPEPQALVPLVRQWYEPRVELSTQSGDSSRERSVEVPVLTAAETVLIQRYRAAKAPVVGVQRREFATDIRGDQIGDSDVTALVELLAQTTPVAPATALHV